MKQGAPVETKEEQVARLTSERDEYKKLYLLVREENERLKRGLLGQKAERAPVDAAQLTMDLLAMLLGEQKPSTTPETQTVKEHVRVKPTGRGKLPENLPRVEIEVVPLEVQRLGLERFDRIGEETSEVLERRQASAVVVRTVRPKFVLKREKAASGATVASEATQDVPRADVAPAAVTATTDATQDATPVEVVGVARPVTACKPSPAVAPVVEVLPPDAISSTTAPPQVVVPPWRRKVMFVKTETPPGTKVFIAPPLPLPILRGLAGPGMLADTVVRRWQDHLPLNRLESIYAREGVPLAKGTICGWHGALGDLCLPLVDAMHADALRQAVLLTDATGVLVQEKKKCHLGHFWVLVAPGLHVLFRYSRHHDSDAVRKNLDGFKGALVADAHTVYDFLYVDNKVVEVGCWAHMRRYWIKAAVSDPSRAKAALGKIGALFGLEKEWKTLSPDKRKAERGTNSSPIVDDYFDWVEREWLTVLEDTPAHDALRYSRNHKTAFCRFIDDGNLPIHNNSSERQLRREAVGRKAWLFVGSDEAADVNATFVSLLASCQMHGLEPWGYLRDLFCLLPDWPHQRVLELAPASWGKTIADPAVLALLDANPLRRVALGMDPVPPQA